MRYEAAQADALATLSSGNFDAPTWWGDKRREATFHTALHGALLDVGRDEAEVAVLLEDAHAVAGAVTAAKAYELRGFSFNEQIVGAADVLVLALEKGVFRGVRKDAAMRRAATGLQSAAERLAAANARAAEAETKEQIAGVSIPCQIIEGENPREIAEALYPGLLAEMPAPSARLRYLVEEADWLWDLNTSGAGEALSECGLSEVEIVGTREEPGIPASDRQALFWLQDDALPALARETGEAAARAVRIALYRQFCRQDRSGLDDMRLARAERALAAATSAGDDRAAALWVAVLGGLRSPGRKEPGQQGDEDDTTFFF
ncbi:hypothetical protein ACXN5S_12130 [Pseudoroseicyclus sp. H15]